MTDSKELFEHGIAYIKRELQDKETECKEYEEFFNYHKNITVRQKVRINRILELRYNEYLDIKNSIRRLQNDLKYFKDKFGYSDERIDSIMPATDELIKADEEQDKKDIIKENKSYGKKRQIVINNLKALYKEVY